MCASISSSVSSLLVLTVSLQALHGKVYDVSRFHDRHPGEGINDQYIYMYGGTDVTVRSHLLFHRASCTHTKQELFEKFHNTDEPFEWLEKSEHGEFPDLTYIGKLEN